MVKYFIDPFAVSGDLSPIPNAVQPGGSISYSQGFGSLYSADPSINPNALPVPRVPFNQLFNDITVALQYWQQKCYPAFITSSDNGGSPYSYSIGNTVSLGGVNYISLTNTNITTPPGSNWKILKQLVNSWNGSTTAVDVTAGSGIDITSGVISFTGGGSFVTSLELQNNNFTASALSSGPSNYVSTFSVGYSPVVDKSGFWVRPNITNVGVTTINVNGGGATEIKIAQGGQLLSCGGGEMVAAAAYYLFKHDFLDIFILANPTTRTIIYGSCMLSGTQVIAGGASALVNFNTVIVDAYNLFSSLPVGTASVPGRYAIQLNLGATGAGVTANNFYYLQRNGSNLATLEADNNLVSVINAYYELNLAAGDTVGIQVFNNSAFNSTIGNIGNIVGVNTLQMTYLGNF